MKIVAMTGNSPRHFAIADALRRTGYLSLHIVEVREPRFPSAPDDTPDDLKKLFTFHFQERDRIEREFFPEHLMEMKGVRKKEITLSELNSEETFEILRKEKPDLLISYGVHKLMTRTLSAVEGKKWNVHGGVSPWYRGCITHFWPTYMLEPQMTGMTVHELTEQLDGGAIVHHTIANLIRGDGVHHTACRAVQGLVNEIPKLIELTVQGKLKPTMPQKTSGKLWTSKDWRPEHLKVVYQLYENRVVDAYLDGKLQKSTYELIRQF